MAAFNWSKVQEVVESAANARNAFLVTLAERREGGRRIIQVFVDTDEGVTIAQCAEISRELGARLDSLGLIEEQYELEVSSPGVDKPLKLLRQYKKNVGRKFSVHYWEGTERKTFEGTLMAVDGEILTFKTEKKESAILEFSKIIESIEELPW
ncbi:MAG TPA: ribosome maturation factor RimP [Bacteroidota bacterium]